MALRHYTGSIPPSAAGRAVWKCPTCGSENAGPLEAGCTACKAGADAKRATQAAVFSPEAEVEADLVRDAFLEWSATLKDVATSTKGDLAARAFAAGAAWQRQQLDNVVRLAAGTQPTTPSGEGGWVLQMTHSDPATWGDPEHMASPLDPRTHDTILAALAFYRDNQLAYGAVPGQLSAEECTQLITKLSPVPEESSL